MNINKNQVVFFLTDVVTSTLFYERKKNSSTKKETNEKEIPILASSVNVTKRASS